MYDVRLFFDIGTRFKFIGCSSLKKKKQKKKKNKQETIYI